MHEEHRRHTRGLMVTQVLAEIALMGHRRPLTLLVLVPTAALFPVVSITLHVSTNTSMTFQPLPDFRTPGTDVRQPRRAEHVPFRMSARRNPLRSCSTDTTRTQTGGEFVTLDSEKGCGPTVRREECRGETCT